MTGRSLGRAVNPFLADVDPPAGLLPLERGEGRREGGKHGGDGVQEYGGDGGRVRRRRGRVRRRRGSRGTEETGARVKSPESLTGLGSNMWEV